MMETQVKRLKQIVFFFSPLVNRKYGYRQSRVYGIPPMPSRHWLLLCFFPAILGGWLLHCGLQDGCLLARHLRFFSSSSFFFQQQNSSFLSVLAPKPYVFVPLVTAGSHGCCRESGKFDILGITNALSRISVLLKRKKLRI